MTGPTLAATYTSPLNTTASPKTVNINTSAGDVLVVMAVSEGTNPWSSTNPSGVTGSSFSRLQSGSGANTAGAGAWKTKVVTGGSYTVTLTCSDQVWGYLVYRFSGADDIGASSIVNASGAPSLGLTTTEANSAICYINADFNESSVGSRTWRAVNSITPTSGNGYEKIGQLVSSHYAVFSAYWPDAGAAGAKTTGLSAPSGQQGYAIAVEVLAGEAAGLIVPVRAGGLGVDATPKCRVAGEWVAPSAVKRRVSGAWV